MLLVAVGEGGWHIGFAGLSPFSFRNCSPRCDHGEAARSRRWAKTPAKRSACHSFTSASANGSCRPAMYGRDATSPNSTSARV